MVRSLVLSGLVLLQVGVATSASAGVESDVADCQAADRPRSAAACTRLLQGKRVFRTQIYVAHYNRAWALRNAGRNVEALADFDKVVALNPRFAEGYLSRGLIQHDLGAFEKSLADVNQYIALKPGSWTGYFNRAVVLRKLDAPDRALADLDKAEALNTDAHEIPLMRGLALSDKGEHSDALTLLDRSIAARPRNALAYYARGLVAFRQKHYGSARADLERALAIEAEFAAAHTLVGRILEAEGQSDAAKDSYRRALAAAGKLFDAGPARMSARERLAALSGPPETGQPAYDTAVTDGRGCSRYLPAVNLTVRVECGS